MTRIQAREAILKEANHWRKAHFHGYLTPKHMNLAVHICRSHNLVSPVVLATAGFREEPREN